MTRPPNTLTTEAAHALAELEAINQTWTQAQAAFAEAGEARASAALKAASLGASIRRIADALDIAHGNVPPLIRRGRRLAREDTP